MRLNESSDSPIVAPRPVCVLSAGRSGTSLAARAMNLLGVYLGEEENLMPASEQNERGFWENLSIYRINEQLLELFDGSWYRPPTLPSGWVDDPRLKPLRELATEVVDELRAENRRWGFKDPRTVVTLPFWRGVVGPMDYIICIRDPLAFIDSVRKLPLPEVEPRATAQLWLDMNIAALRQTVGDRRMFVLYDEWFDDPCAMTRRLAAFIYGDAASIEQSAADAIDAFVDSNLRHAHAVEGAVIGVPVHEAMYVHLRSIAAHDPEDRDARLRQVNAAEAIADTYRLRREQESESP